MRIGKINNTGKEEATGNPNQIGMTEKAVKAAAVGRTVNGTESKKKHSGVIGEKKARKARTKVKHKDTKEVKGGGRNRNNGGGKNRHSMMDGHMVTTPKKNGVNNEINARQAKMRKRRVTIGTTVHEM